PRRSWLTSFWPQISLATAVAVVLVTGSVFWFRAQTETNNATAQLAMNAPVAPKDATETLRSLDAPQVDRLEKSEASKSADVAIAAAPPAETASSFAGTAEVKSFQEVAQAPAAAKVAAPAMATRSFTQEPQALTANLSQRFSQNVSGKMAAGDDAKLKRRANVLNTFDVQQEGDKIRVVDEDGSTYTGKLEQITQNDRRSLAQKNQQNFVAQAGTATKPAEENESNEYFFRAAGFNSSLKKNVVFEANYVAPPTDNQQNAATKEARRDEQNQARIVGTAKIPGEPPVEVDAVSVAR
ncbi:MAG: hypothetical protein M3R10_03810, partial [Verrucomicrobiota bacterium]|nr:hypothetical protein [Verrucomicrobiota bacterium]